MSVSLVLELKPAGSDDSFGLSDSLQRLRFSAPATDTAAQAVFLSGLVRPPVLCSGVGRCGRCRMGITINGQTPPLLPQEALILKPEEAAAGIRLGCMHQVTEGMVLTIVGATTTPAWQAALDEAADEAATQAGLPIHADAMEPAPAASNSPSPASPTGASSRAGTSALMGEDHAGLDTPVPGADDADLDEPVSVAVDFGTTSVCAKILLADGRVDSEMHFTNPQMGAGADVVSRLAYAQEDEGFLRLRRAANNALADIVERGAAGRPCLAVCLAGNPTMTSLVMGWSISGLAAAPYGLPHKGGFWADLTDIPDFPLTFIPPQLSPFVGGDISAGYAALAHTVLTPGAFAGEAPVFPFVLADFGTNGEIILALSPEEAVVSSVALGPALEGAGLTFGSEARSGVITGFSISPKGFEPRFFDAQTTPKGISGTGYLSLAACLIRAGAMDVDGHFTPEKSPLLRKYFSAEGGGRYLLPGGMYLPAGDVEEMLKVKAAFSLGLQRVLQQAGLSSKDPAVFYLAGALGLHVATEDLELLGFFPPGGAARLRPRGNTSLDGAALLLQSEELRRALCRWAAGVKTYAPAEDPLFQQHFAHHMRFAWGGSD